jgi:hypothetical protein
MNILAIDDGRLSDQVGGERCAAKGEESGTKNNARRVLQLNHAKTY